jgi:beta-glucosidase
MINPFFMFATGIEGSIPTIQGGRVRVDEMEKCGFYKNWKTDLELLEDVGVRFLRFGPPLHRTFLGPDRYDWSSPT